MSATLEKELETYRREMPTLRSEAGKYALISDSKVLSTWSTYEDAIQEGYKLCGLEPFLVKRIEEIETAHFISRIVEPICQL